MKLVIAQALVGDLDHNKIVFDIIPSGNKFRIETNLNFDVINKERKLVNKRYGDITPSQLVQSFLSAKLDAVFAAHYGGEFYTSELSSNIMRIKQKELLKRVGIERNEINEFSAIVTGEYPCIREVINCNERTFSEFLNLLDKSDKFKEWASGVNPDEKLVKEYLEAVTSVGWINKIPSKSLRYVLGATIGAVDSGGGLVASAADTFILERLLGGWRPSHFVNRYLKPFLDYSELDK